jgi:hypothetical protein
MCLDVMPTLSSQCNGRRASVQHWACWRSGVQERANLEGQNLLTN